LAPIKYIQMNIDNIFYVIKSAFISVVQVLGKKLQANIA